jgi:Rieske Fe-S protein
MTRRTPNRGRAGSRSRSAVVKGPAEQHLRNAAVEVLQAARILLEEGMARVREPGQKKRLTRVRVRG